MFIFRLPSKTSAGIAWSIERQATGWIVLGSNPGGDEIFPYPFRLALGPKQLPEQWVAGLGAGDKLSGAWR